jgi:hypothetical protein
LGEALRDAPVGAHGKQKKYQAETDRSTFLQMLVENANRAARPSEIKPQLMNGQTYVLGQGK